MWFHFDCNICFLFLFILLFCQHKDDIVDFIFIGNFVFFPVKSRVLLSMVDETEDSTLYSPYGPITPGGTGKESQLQDPLLTCEKGPEISMPTSEEKSESQKVEVVTVDARIGQLNETVDDQSTRAIMHPDIAASADFLKDQSSKAIEVETA